MRQISYLRWKLIKILQKRATSKYTILAGNKFKNYKLDSNSPSSNIQTIYK